MNRTLLTAAMLQLLLVGCPTNHDANNAPVPDDVGADVDGTSDVAPNTEHDAEHDVAPAARVLQRSVPLAEVATNRLEDPLLTLQNDSWYAVVSPGNAAHRVQRLYETHAPVDMAIVGIPPADGGSLACVLGRMKWGAGLHRASVWLDFAGAPNDAVSVTLVGLRLDDAPTWVEVALAPTGATHDGNGRAWVQWGGTSPERFGWGYFQVCSAAAEAVFFTAPQLTTTDTSDALLLHAPDEAASPDTVQRVEQFNRWRERH